MIERPPDFTGPDALMVFDGVCNFCSGYVRFVAAIDRDEAIHFTSIQSPYGAKLCRTNGIDSTNPSTFLFIRRGHVFEGADAMIAMFECLPAPWRWLSAFGIVPRAWRDAVYRWTARNRYRLLGKRDACMMPDARLRSRFIDELPAP